MVTDTRATKSKWRRPTLAMAIGIVAVFAWWMTSDTVIPAPNGIPERYVLHVSPTLLAGVEDTIEKEIVLWYDMDTGPDLKRIERLENGDWLAVLAPRK